MAKVDYLIRLRCSGVAALSSSTCSWCYPSGIRNSFFGVPVTGTQLGSRPQDHEFRKNIWKAAQKHMRDVHGRKIVANGAGGWKIVKISE
jgi:hypothetical protein